MLYLKSDLVVRKKHPLTASHEIVSIALNNIRIISSVVVLTETLCFYLPKFVCLATSTWAGTAVKSEIWLWTNRERMYDTKMILSVLPVLAHKWLQNFIAKL